MGEEHSGFDLSDGQNIDLLEALGTDHTWTGITCNGTAGENLVFGELAYYKSDSKWWKAKADAAATTEGLLAMVTGTINANNSGVLLLIGFMRDDHFDWTVGDELYVFDDTGGDLIATQPSDSGDQVRKVAYAVTADIIWFNPDGTLIEIA